MRGKWTDDPSMKETAYLMVELGNYAKLNGDPLRQSGKWGRLVELVSDLTEEVLEFRGRENEISLLG